MDAASLRTLMLKKSVTLKTITITKDTEERVTAESEADSTISAEIQFGGQEMGENKLYSKTIITGDAELYTAPGVLSIAAGTTRYKVVYDGKTYAVEKQLDSIHDHTGTALVDVFTLRAVTA